MKTVSQSVSQSVSPKFDAPLRSAESLMKAGVRFEANGLLLIPKGIEFSVRDIPALASVNLIGAETARDRVLGLLAFAEKQDAIPLLSKDAEGKEVSSSVGAFKYVMEELAKDENISIRHLSDAVSLLPRFKQAIANGMKLSRWLEFAGPAEKLGALINSDTLLLTPPPESAGEKRKSFEKLEAVIKSGVSVQAKSGGVRKTLEVIKAAHPDVFPKRGRVASVAPAASGVSLTNDNTVIKNEIPKLTHDAASIRSAIQKVRMALEFWRTQSDLATQEAVKAGKSLPEAKSLSETAENQEDAKVCHELVIQMCRSTNPNPVKK